MDDKKLKTLAIDQLSKILHKSPETIRSDLVRNPQSLPPVLRLPRSRKPLWRLKDVEDWLEAHVE